MTDPTEQLRNPMENIQYRCTFFSETTEAISIYFKFIYLLHFNYCKILKISCPMTTGNIGKSG